MILRRALLLAAALAGLAGPGRAACRQALAIGLDVSGSVDPWEYLLQVRGVASALLSDKVRAALLETPQSPVMLAVYDWSGAADQRLILPWTALTDAALLETVATRIAATARRARSPSTGVGSALEYGAALLGMQGACWSRVLDLTGDGLNNSGVRPRDVVLDPAITVNALVIGVNRDEGWDGGDPGMAELTAWFSTEVIRGPDAFVETALGFEDFADAMRRKLIKELAGIRIGRSQGRRSGRPALP